MANNQRKRNGKYSAPQTFTLINKFHVSSSADKLFGTLNPFRILDTWYELEKLKYEWDPNFNLQDFKSGAKQALCTVVNLVQQNSWNELRGLICIPLIEKLQKDDKTLRKIKETEELTLDSIVSANLCRVALQEIVENKYCDIDVSLKIGAKVREERIVTFQYILRFHREYTRGKLPHWTINKLQVEEKEEKS